MCHSKHEPIKIVLQSFEEAAEKGLLAFWSYKADYRLFIQYERWDYLVMFDKDKFTTVLRNAAAAIERAIERDKARTDSRKV